MRCNVLSDAGLRKSSNDAIDTLSGRDRSDPELDLVKSRITFTRAVADWCLRQARQFFDQGNLEAALDWNYFAAGVLTRGCSPLVSETLERNLLEIASCLPRFEWRRRCDHRAPKRWLHVIDYAIPYGGPTAMARRWIASEKGNGVHSVALPDQIHPVPDSLADAVRESGGEIFLPAPNSSRLSRANWLRKLAYAKADCVVLHVTPDDVVAPTSFGVDGGPPILFVNQSAHTFWAGASVADLVLNCRGSQLELSWTRRYRGISNFSTLPIPVEPPQLSGNEIFSAEVRAEARRRLNLPADAIVLLSVGREEKYTPMPRLSFFEVARSLLASFPQARMLVVGPAMNAYRRKLSEEVDGRLAVVGRQSDLQLYYAAADVYLESFPFGSTTALLEAGVHGLPCVLAPADCPPPFGTDGIAVDDELQRPASVDEYVQRVKELIMHPEERICAGASLASAIRKHHCGAGWARYLSDVIGQVPEVHSLRPIVQPPSPPEEFNYYWARYISSSKEDPFFQVVLNAVSSGITPRLDVGLFRACRAARNFRHREGWRREVLPVLSSALMPWCPVFLRSPVYGSFKGLWRLKRWLKSFLSRKDSISEAAV